MTREQTALLLWVFGAFGVWYAVWHGAALAKQSRERFPRLDRIGERIVCRLLGGDRSSYERWHTAYSKALYAIVGCGFLASGVAALYGWFERP